VILDPPAAQGGRYRLLETIRQYAAGRLEESGEAEETGRRHAAAFLSLAERASAFQRRPGLAAWLERLEAAHDDIRQALRWYRRRDQALWIRLVLSLAWFWQARGHLAEGHDWLSGVLEAPALTGHDRARALFWLCRLALWQGDYEVAVDLGERSLKGFREAGDDVSAGWALDLLGTIHGYAGHPVQARSCLEELLATATDEELRVTAAASLGEHLLLLGDLAGARSHLERAAASGGPEGRWQIPWGALFLAAADILEGDLAGGRRRLDALLEMLDRTRDVFALSGALYLAAALAFLSENRPERALRLCGAADAWREKLRTPLAPAWGDLLRSMIVDPATARLTPAAAMAAWSEGARMSFGAAVLLARGDGASVSPVEEARAAGLADDPAPLSHRELEVALLTARGLTNRLIAERLQIAERTVEGHLERIRAKLGVGSRAQVAVWVVERGWLAG
jgi:non-specific serine/threonine protein kinase